MTASASSPPPDDLPPLPPDADDIEAMRVSRDEARAELARAAETLAALVPGSTCTPEGIATFVRSVLAPEVKRLRDATARADAAFARSAERDALIEEALAGAHTSMSLLRRVMAAKP